MFERVKIYRNRPYAIQTGGTDGVVSAVLRGNDGSCNHRIALWKSWLFDSNCPCAYPISSKILDWCVDGNNTGVVFDRISLAYELLPGTQQEGRRRRARKRKKSDKNEEARKKKYG